MANEMYLIVKKSSQCVFEFVGGGGGGGGGWNMLMVVLITYIICIYDIFYYSGIFMVTFANFK